MKNMSMTKLTATALGTVLAVGCAGTAVSKKQTQMPMAAKQTPAVTTPAAKPQKRSVSPIKVAQAQPSEAGASEQQKFPYITLPAESKPQQRTFHFGFDKAQITEADREILKEHAEYLQDHPEAVLQIQGHTDHHGPKAYNEYLSKKRAEAIATTLIEQGAPESQLVIDALADSQPLQDVHNTARNRRVELEYKVLEMVHSD